MDVDMFFDIDRYNDALYINRRYRKRLLNGLPGSGVDLPVLKCLLFLLLESELSSERAGPKIKRQIDRINSILVQAVKYERS